MATETILALDFGGTKLAAGVMDRCTGQWLAMGRASTPALGGAEAVLTSMLALADAQLAQAGGVLGAVGISFDGPVDMALGCPRTCHHVAGWEGLPLRERVMAHYGVAAVLENDANAAAYGEWRYGAGQGCREMLYITVSTGVGGGLILNGDLYRGACGLAGEIGHLCLEPEGPLCPCGRRGCLEALAAGPAIVRRFRQLVEACPAIPSDLRGRSAVTSEEIDLAARSGDELAGRAIDGAARALGVGIGNALNLLNLERVVVGGGVTRAGEGYLARVREAACHTVLDGVPVKIVLAALGHEAPLWGAAALAAGALGA